MWQPNFNIAWKQQNGIKSVKKWTITFLQYLNTIR